MCYIELNVCKAPGLHRSAYTTLNAMDIEWLGEKQTLHCILICYSLLLFSARVQYVRVDEAEMFFRLFKAQFSVSVALRVI